MNLPNFEFEEKLWSKGLRIVAGADEVGRGCFAGPVVAATVVFSPELTIEQLHIGSIEINDSKKLSAKKREYASEWIKENALLWGIGSADVREINDTGVGKATQKAFRRAVRAADKSMDRRIEFLLVDAFFVPHLRNLPAGKKRQPDLNDLFNESSRQLAIKKGDSKSLSIAAASIVAKVHRDELMKKLGQRKEFKKYDWHSNKGYASKRHREAIIEYGVTKHHRIQFVETFLKNNLNK